MKMNRKEFVHQDSEMCKLCGKEVRTKIDGWVAIIDYIGENHNRTAIYHKDCLNDLLEGQGKVIQDKFKEKLSQTLGNMFKGIKQMNQPQY